MKPYKNILIANINGFYVRSFVLILVVSNVGSAVVRYSNNAEDLMFQQQLPVNFRLPFLLCIFHSVPQNVMFALPLIERPALATYMQRHQS